MSRYTDILEVSPLADGVTWVLRKEFGYDIGQEGSGDTIDVPLGFMTDFASIPRIFRFLVSKWGKHGNAAVLHDYCYWSQNRSREESDRILKEAMEVSKTKAWRVFLIYWAVRLGGAFAWSSNQARRVNKFSRVAARLPDTATAPPASLAGAAGLFPPS